jgi:hypothetical protein
VERAVRGEVVNAAALAARATMTRRNLFIFEID